MSTEDDYRPENYAQTYTVDEALEMLRGEGFPATALDQYRTDLEDLADDGGAIIGADLADFRWVLL